MKITGVVLGVSEVQKSLIEDLKKICFEIIYVPLIKKQQDTGLREIKLNFDGDMSKFKNTILSYVTGEYVFFVMSNESIKDISPIYQCSFDKETYIFNVIDRRSEGVVVTKQIRLHKRYITYTGIDGQNVSCDSNEQLDAVLNTMYDSDDTIKDIYSFLSKKVIVNDKQKLCYKIFLDYMANQLDDVLLTYKTNMNVDYDVYTKRIIGLSFYLLEKYIEAKMIFEEIKEELSEAYYYLGLISKELDNYNDAINYLLTALKQKNTADVYLWGYNNFLSFYNLAEIYFYLEDYNNSLRYYTNAYKIKNDYVFLNRMFIIFNLLDINVNVVENYLRDNLNIEGKNVYINMMRGLRDTSKWDEVLKYSVFEDDIESIETRILAYYHLGEYGKSLDLIMTYFNYIDKELFSVVGICCVILEESLYSTRFCDFVDMLKRDGYGELIDVHNFLAFNIAYKGNIIYIEAVVKMLLRAKNGKVIRCIRHILYSDLKVNYYDLMMCSYKNKLYDICDEIIDRKYIEYKFDFNVLAIKAKIAFANGNYQECEKFISYALMIKESEELKKLLCMCKIKSCVQIINADKNINNKVSTKKLISHIDIALREIDIFKLEQ